MAKYKRVFSVNIETEAIELMYSLIQGKRLGNCICPACWEYIRQIRRRRKG